MAKIFIDGSAGTTGLRIYDRLSEREDINLISIDEEKRKDNLERAKCINEADVVFLCLPDAAAIEAVTLVENPDTVIIDTSTAHRTAPGWEYGFAELTGRREKIAASKRIANPGCHASGFVSLIAPLVECGALKKDALLSCFSLTGYSGGGKKMIADYENPEMTDELRAPRMYALTQKHKHLPEMAKICGIDEDPVFCPIVSSYYSGMEVTVPLFGREYGLTKSDVEAVYRDYYKSEIIKFVQDESENGFLSGGKLSGLDSMHITVHGNDDRILLVSRFDNLGKGASGAAIQNMNIVLGIDENTGLKLVED